jgi:cyclophilin family peptidyl-prolyl cis-trans isomerase
MTFIPTTWLDGKHTVFGRVVEGFEVLDQLEAIGSKTGTPSQTAIIADCGELL